MNVTTPGAVLGQTVALNTVVWPYVEIPLRGSCASVVELVP
jgi:hypothetical protein